MRPLATLPKAHLHLHLEGAMRPATLAELAGKAGMSVPAIRGYGSFVAFADMYHAACEVLRTAEDFARLIAEVAADAAAAGAVWLEPALWAPLHADRLGDAREVLELALEAGRDAEKATGVGIGWMVSADRTRPPSEALAQARLAAEYADRGVVAFGLANDEARFPPEPFADAFALAREAGLLSTPHAGELAGPASVRGALDNLGPRRIQHGVRAIEDPALVARLAAEQICLDVCPTSNLLLSVVPDLAEHPLPRLLAAGVPCSVNSDDPLLFGSGLLEEYALCRDRMGLDDDAMATIARASLRFSGAPEEVRAGALKAVDAWLADD
jgi:adenosine deaminase